MRRILPVLWIGQVPETAASWVAMHAVADMPEAHIGDPAMQACLDYTLRGEHTLPVRECL